MRYKPNFFSLDANIMNYHYFATIIASGYDENLYCMRCNKPESKQLCKNCLSSLDMFHCKSCSSLYFNGQMCDVCNNQGDQHED